jgi:hypothetical protein
LGTVSLKKVKKRSKGLQMLSARRHCFCLEIQTIVKSFEADRKNRVTVLSLLRSYEGATALAYAGQKQHPNAVHGMSLEEAIQIRKNG